MEDQTQTHVADFLPLTATNSRRFVETFSSQIASQAMRFQLPADLIQDVVQETLIRALRGLPRFRGDSRLSTWVYRIAYRECLRIKQKHQRHQGGVQSLDDVGETVTHEMEPSAIASTSDEAMRVRRMMLQLPESQRLTLGYHYLDSLSVTEIATLMDSTPNTVKSWLKRGRETLRDLLGQTNT